MAPVSAVVCCEKGFASSPNVVRTAVGERKSHNVHELDVSLQHIPVNRYNMLTLREGQRREHTYKKTRGAGEREETDKARCLSHAAPNVQSRGLHTCLNLDSTQLARCCFSRQCRVSHWCGAQHDVQCTRQTPGVCGADGDHGFDTAGKCWTHSQRHLHVSLTRGG